MQRDNNLMNSMTFHCTWWQTKYIVQNVRKEKKAHLCFYMSFLATAMARAWNDESSNPNHPPSNGSNIHHRNTPNQCLHFLHPPPILNLHPHHRKSPSLSNWPYGWAMCNVLIEYQLAVSTFSTSDWC